MAFRNIANIEIVFHGGLGNQLFQAYFALCLSRSLSQEHKITLNTLFLKSYSPPRDFELGEFDLSKLFRCEVCNGSTLSGRMRLPKARRRLFGKEKVISILGHCIVDGYFQQTESYSAFENEILVDSLNALRRQMPDSVVASPNGGDSLYHVRLGDGAFDLGASENKFLTNFIQKYEPKFIMTDKEGAFVKVHARLITQITSLFKARVLRRLR